MRKSKVMMGVFALAMLAMTACSSKGVTETTVALVTESTEVTSGADQPETETEETAIQEETIMVAAAASLQNCLKEELIPLFEEIYPGLTVQGTYDSSGKLQTQIEEGADVDVFFSASTKQMNALAEQDMIEDGSAVDLLENKIVLIVPVEKADGYSVFEDIVKADQIAIGDPESVPVGQYAKESLENLGLWEEVLGKASLGTNVTEVLNWVAEGSADAGVVYATDAAQTDQVLVVAEAPEGSVKKAVYPVGIVKGCSHPDGAAKFIEFLQSEEAIKIFEKNGFVSAN